MHRLRALSIAFLAFGAAVSADARAGALRDQIEERKAAVANPAYGRDSLYTRRNFNPRREERPEELKILARHVSDRVSAYTAGNADAILSDVRDLLDQALVSLSTLKTDFAFYNRRNPSGSAVAFFPRYLGPDAFVHLLYRDLLSAIPQPLRSSLSPEFQQRLAYLINAKLGALENAMLEASGTAPAGWLRQNAHLLTSWFVPERLDTELRSVRISSTGYAQRSGLNVTPNRYAEIGEASPLKCLQNAVKEISVERRTRRRQSRTRIEDAVQDVFNDLLYRATPDGKDLVPRNPRLLEAIFRREGKTVIFHEDGQMFARPIEEFSPEFQIWAFLQIDRAFRADPGGFAEDFEGIEVDWSQYSRAIVKKLRENGHADLLPAIEMNKVTLPLLQSRLPGMSGNSLEDLYHLTAFDSLRLLHDPGAFRDGLLGFFATDGDLALHFEFLLTTADPATRLLLSSAIWSVIRDTAKAGTLFQSGARNPARAAAFLQSMADLESANMRNAVLADFAAILRARGAEHPEWIDPIQGAFQSYFAEGGLRYRMDHEGRGPVVCLLISQ